MTKTFRKKQVGKTVKSRNTSTTFILKNFQKEITIVFFEMILMIKLYHWKTHKYATHKATDQLYEELNGHMDKFIEVLLGKSGVRTDLMNTKSIKLIDLDSQKELINKINYFKSYLVALNSNKAMKLMANSDLFNIRDEIMADLNQFLYLLTFQ
jgi:DNA-binding ferritin-like protein